jgi:hypothetical protein
MPLLVIDPLIPSLVIASSPSNKKGKGIDETHDSLSPVVCNSGRSDYRSREYAFMYFIVKEGGWNVLEYCELYLQALAYQPEVWRLLNTLSPAW